jgi:hypothetical protein
MDKWDEIIHRIQQAALAEEPEAALTAGLQLFAEFGRTLETISGDMDRIATALGSSATEFEQKVLPPVLDL